METHKIHVVIPEDHRLVVDVPESIRSGPAELILMVSEEGGNEQPPAAREEALAKWDSVTAALAKDPRPFHSLTLEEKRKRHQLMRGIGKGILPSSAAIAEAKREEVELEDLKFGR